jgi:hypothetical protein
MPMTPFTCSFFHRFQQFLLHYMCQLKLYKKNWNAKTIEWHLKILSSRMQTGHICQPTSCLWPPSLVKDISCSFLHEFEWFLLHWMRHLKLYKTFWRPKIIEWRQKILSFRMQIGHMCQPTSCTWPPSLGKGISCSFLHRIERFLLHKMCQMKGYKKNLNSKSNRPMYKDL